MTDDGGVLENLPRSRPGHRSEKRAAKTAGADKRPASAATAPPRKRPQSAATPPPRKRPAGAAAPPPGAGHDRSAPRAGDPVGDAIRTVAGVASSGARVAGGVAREVLRRLPRP